MFHSPIQIKNLGLSNRKKTCFKNFNTIIYPGQNIAIVGRNGSGKTTLLKILQNKFEAFTGEIFVPNDVLFGYVPQIINLQSRISGAEEFNNAFQFNLSRNPNVLILDEPTNHLDLANRNSLIKALKLFKGTIIIASHDREIIDCCSNIIWHIDNEKVAVFTGNYNDYLRELALKRRLVENELAILSSTKRAAHLSLMKEQQRAKNSRVKGERNKAKKKWPTIVSDAKARQGDETAGRKKAKISKVSEELNNKLSFLKTPEIIIPKFYLPASINMDKNIINISNGSCGYNQSLLNEIYFTLNYGDRISISGSNSSGKTTFIKAILNDQEVTRTGEWYLPNVDCVGYLDQHYNVLDTRLTVFETIANLVPKWNDQEIRKHLNNFLFRKNEEVNTYVADLSGGEKARLALARIGVKAPILLVLDEVTNNLDYETKTHISQIMKAYYGTLIIVSHDTQFLNDIDLSDNYTIMDRKILKNST